MESTARQRKGKSVPQHQNVKIREHSSNKSNGLSCLTKFFGFLLALACIIGINVFWPRPALSKSVQQWKDAGYYFRMHGHEIFYQDIRSPDYDSETDHVLVAIHGFPTSSYDWKMTLPALGKYFSRIIIPDLLGLGFSSKPFPYNYTIAEHADIVTNLLLTSFVSKVHILAQDIGVNIAQEMLRRQQEDGSDVEVSIESLCLADGPVLSTHYKHQPLQKVLLNPYLRNIAPLVMNRYLFMWRFNAVTGVPLPREVLNDVYAILMYNDGHLAAPYVLNYIPEIFSIGPTWEKALEKTKLPMHLIFGPRDPTSSYGEFLKEYKRRFPRSTVTYIETAGHFINMEEPEKFMEGIGEYAKVLGIKPKA